ncbi:MAG: glycosyltransferase [Geitlerinemataceae cyanobacterium]
MHIGLYCPAETGHLNTMLPLGEALQARGHRVTFVGIEDARDKVEAARLDFFAIATNVLPEGSMDEILETLGELKGLPALLYTVKAFRDTSEKVLKHGAIACKDLQLDGMVIDQATAEASAIARFLDVPYVTVCSALPFDPEPGVPPLFSTWTYKDAWLPKLRNALIHGFFSSTLGAIVKAPIRAFFKAQNLALPENLNSPVAMISHQPKSFEFPREKLPVHFHFTGPYHTTTSRKPVDFSWERLTGEPLIYASMGTLQNRLSDVFQTIATACENLSAQLVISLGGSGDPADLPPLPGNPIVVRYAPQIELLKKATLTITHAGMNTTLESLTHGVPMVAIPVTNDQPGIAARIKWTGAGEFVPLDRLDAETLRKLVSQVLETPSYRDRAQSFAEEIATSGGTKLAVSIIETALADKQPVVSVQANASERS